MPAKQNRTDTSSDNLTFEQALARLEELVQQMERGDLSLDQMMAAFEEGMRLNRFCAVRLDEVDRKLEILVREGAEIKAAPFDPEVTVS